MPYTSRRAKRGAPRAATALTAGLALATAAAAWAPCAARAQQPPRNTLKGFAALPAETFAAGPRSGQLITGDTNGVTVPFDRQPVQGFSSVLSNGDGTFTALADNGYGAKANSPDFVLRLYTITPDFKTAAGGTGAVSVNGFVSLSDPDRKVSFSLVADGPTYPGSSIAVDAAIRNNRQLTGGDFDIESFRRVSDGTYWFGDEFGPFLLHTDASGRLLDAPISLPNFNQALFGGDPNPLVQSPSNPLLGTSSANLNNSNGFEGMALSADGTRLFTLLEGSLTTDPNRQRLLINEFDIAGKRYTGGQFFYRKEVAGNAIGEITAVNESEYLVIERDNNQGPAAAFKRIFLVNLNERDADGFVKKTLLVDLLDLDDPNNLGGLGGGKFTFPFVTIESVAVIDENTIAVLNDNNFPFSSGRTPGRPDNNEFILIGLGTKLRTTPQNVIPEPSTVAFFAGALPLLVGGAAVRARRK